ncbi:MAG: heme ABC transporter ATP-binding protein, partial [Treponemataceae bacterium]|nr:heme ABC transporter ATP-binding protein [Treponemataceae bacterium]
VTILMITHDMHLMLEYTPRAIAFSNGHLLADTSSAAVLCNPDLIESAALKETSLFTLAARCGIEEDRRVAFVDRFIEFERGNRNGS